MVDKSEVRDFLSNYNAEDIEQIIEIAKEVKEDFNRDRFDDLLNDIMDDCDCLVKDFPEAEVVIKDNYGNVLVSTRIANLIKPNSGYTLTFWIDDNTRY